MFTVSGKPFMPMGGQAHNSSAYNAAEIASAIAGVKALNGNTLIAPVYWEQIEPQEGRFDFSPLDSLLEECRQKRSAPDPALVCHLEKRRNALLPRLGQIQPGPASSACCAPTRPPCRCCPRSAASPCSPTRAPSMPSWPTCLPPTRSAKPSWQSRSRTSPASWPPTAITARLRKPPCAAKCPRSWLSICA